MTHADDDCRAELEAARRELTRWKSRAQQCARAHEQAARGLRAAIDAGFRRWRLTEAEAEVGLLLIKGLPLRDIAVVRETTERTARQQAREVYRKAGLAGRAELAAWFLEDLLSEPPVRALPDGLLVTGQTREFDQDTVPAGLLADHRTREGTWGRLEVLDGSVDLRFADGRVHCTVARAGIIPPQEPHGVELDGPVRFRVVFLRRPEDD